MKNFLSDNKLVLAAAALIIAGALWYGFSGSTSSAVLGTEGAGTAVNAEDQDLVATLLKLRSVDLSGTIFQSEAFLGLKDFSTEITDEPIGRADPFAPLSESAPASAQPASGSGNSGDTGLFKKPR